VAFVGHDWEDILGEFGSRIRLICWLSSTNTNPHAVGQMLERGLDVRQIDAMHAKVYLMSGTTPAAIVGSANLSGAALAADGALGQFDAGVLVRSPVFVHAVQDWFSSLWDIARPITSENLQQAINAWEVAHRNRPPRRAPSGTSLLPVKWSPPRSLEPLVRKARKMDPASELEEYRVRPVNRVAA
jgi:hypothetical protein